MSDSSEDDSLKTKIAQPVKPHTQNSSENISQNFSAPQTPAASQKADLTPVMQDADIHDQRTVVTPKRTQGNAPPPESQSEPPEDLGGATKIVGKVKPEPKSAYGYQQPSQKTVKPDNERIPFEGGEEASGDQEGDARSDRKPPASSEFSQKKLPAEIQQMLGRTLDGYKIEKLLGAGGMGAVFLAHQTSLDRSVAMKVLPERFSSDPDLVARFTREALSAAQLSHHNIVQVFDIGNVNETYYISMEYVRGRTVGDIIRKEGRLSINDAAGYILQAARGLQYAHKRGIIHRDIKPDNLMLNEHGIIKIADMGLAKWKKNIEASNTLSPDKQRLLMQKEYDELTMANIALGTPAYMSPEQARDAASVDPRADQYSLGCTLYYMCAGKAPYSGTTVFDLISKHMNEPLIPLNVHVKGVPVLFSRIIEKMLAKTPEERYADMGEVIRDLEGFLGVESEKGAYTPREQHMAMLNEEQKNYYSVPAMKKRKLAKLAFFIILPLIFLATLFGGDFAFAGGLLGLTILTPLASFIINGILSKDYLFRRVRSVFFGMSMKTWLAFIGNVALIAALLVFLGWFAYWIGFALVAFALAMTYQFLILKPLKAQRKKPVDLMYEMLRELRVRGVSEEAIKDFIWRFSDVNWEEFFEDLFGYEDMIIARGKAAAADKARSRKKYASWREPIANWLDGIEKARKEAREKRQLAKAEKQRLKAQGVSEKDAEAQAELEATQFIKSNKAQEEALAEREASLKIKKLISFNLKTINTLFTILICAAAAAGALCAGARVLPQYKIDALNFLAGFVPKVYYEQGGHSGTIIGLAASVILFIMAFSSRIIAKIAVILGVILLLFPAPIIAIVNQPYLNLQTAFWGGALLAAGGFIVCLYSSISGGKF